MRLTRSVLPFVTACALYGQSTGQAPPKPVVKEQGYLPFADAPINYRSENLSDPVARLQ